MADFGLAARADQTGSRIPAQAGRDSELAAEPVLVAGQTPLEAAKAGLDCITAQFPFPANGRAMTLESTDGFVRVVARRARHCAGPWRQMGPEAQGPVAACGGR